MSMSVCNSPTLAFAASGNKPKIAILMVLLGVDRAEAERLEQAADGSIARALELAHR